MPLRTWRICTFPVVSSFFPVFFGPLPGCHTNVRGMLHRLLRLGARAVAELRRLDATLASDLVHRRELRQSVHRRAHHVVRVRRAEALRQDVVDAHALHDRANRATGDHAGARRRGLHPYLARAVLARDLVRDRRSRERHGDEVAASRLDGLADRFRDLVRLPRREADLPLAVADGDERVEAEPASALHDFRDTVDRDHVLDQVAAFALLTAPLVAAAAAAAPTTIAAALAAAAGPAATTLAAARTSATAPAAAATGAAASAPATRSAATTAAAAPCAATTAGAAAAAAALSARTRIRFHVFRTPARLRGLRRPPLSRGRDTDIHRGRTRPSRSPCPWRSRRSASRPRATFPPSSLRPASPT